MEASEKLILEHYTGDMAKTYESGRKRKPKWQKEQQIVEDFIATNENIKTVIDAPLGTNRYGLFLERCSHVKIVYGYEYADDMIAEAKKTISTKLEIFKHDLVNEKIKERADLSIIMRMLNLFDEENTIKILKNILEATETYSLVGLRYWKQSPEHIENKITIQNFDAISNAIHESGFKITNESKIAEERDGQYSVFTLERI